MRGPDMRKSCIALLAGWASIVPAMADDVAAGEDVEKGQNWSVSATVGTAGTDGDGDQRSVRLGVTRVIGAGYVRASWTRFATREGAGLAGAVPASTQQVTLAAGYGFGALSVDGYVSYGRRKFDREAFRRETGSMIEIVSDGSTAGGGLSLTYAITLDERMLLSPFVAADISRVDTARAITVVGRGTISQKERQTGETGSLGFTLDRSIGKDAEHRIGFYAAGVTTSNPAVASRSSSPAGFASLFGPLDVPGSKDSWGEYGVSASFRLVRPVSLDLAVVRTAGFRGGDSTSLSAGLRLGF
jgi:hypothetical protein